MMTELNIYFRICIRLGFYEKYKYCGYKNNGIWDIKKQNVSFDEPFLAHRHLTLRGTIHSESGNFHFKCIWDFNYF